MGSLIEFGPVDGATELRIYVSGDTLFVDELAEIPRRYPSIDTGVFHLGGTTLPFGQSPKRGLMVTMDAVQGVRAIELIGPATAIPVHFDDYGVFASPLADFVAEATAHHLDSTIRYVERGQTITLGRPSE